MTDSFFSAVEEQAGVNFTEVTPERKLELERQAVPNEYSVTDFDSDPVVMGAHDTIMDYLSENKTVATGILDSFATTGNQSRPSEMLRDDVMRIGAPAAKAIILKDAPENVKSAYRLLQSRFDKAEVTGTGEQVQRVLDYGSDIIFNPEMAATVASLIAAPFTGGGSFAASQAAKQTAKVAARNKLKNAIAATGAAVKNNPKKFATAVGAYYGGAGNLAAQNLDVSLDKKDEVSLGELGFSTVAGGTMGYGLYRAGSAIGNRYFKQATDPEADVSPTTMVTIFDEALEGEFLPKNTGKLIDEAFRLTGPTTKVVNVGDKLEAEAAKFAKSLGGGEQTKADILGRIRRLANSEKTDEFARSEFKQYLYEKAANLTGYVFGKAGGILSPHLKVSGTARQLQEKLSYEFAIKTSKKEQKRVEKDLSEVQREVTGKFNEKFRAVVDELNLANKEGELADSINDAIMITLRSNKPVTHSNLDAQTNKAINKAAASVKDLYNEMGVKLKDIGVIDELVDNYVPRMWNRNAIEDNKTGFVDLLVKKGGFSRGDAKRTVDSMLDIKNQVDSGGGSGYFFSAKRNLNDIAEEADFQEFLNSDVLGSLNAYTFQAGKALAKHRVLGVNNIDQFNKFWTNRIKSEVEKAGGKFTKAHENQISSLYKHATGEGMERFGRTGQNIADAYGLTTRLSYLGLATLSSLTEVFLNLSRAGTVNSIKGLGEAMDIGFKSITGNLEKKLMSEHGLTAKEAMAEMRSFSIAVNQNLSQIGNRLAGDDLVNEKMQSVSNKFFKVNLLDQWTKFVQTVSFSTGKRLIKENLEVLSGYGSKPLDKKGLVLADELKDLDIDYKKGIAWLRGGAQTNDSFYKSQFLGGAARYTDSIILQPTAMSGLKPLAHTNPKTSVLFQLLGYPVAFTNTVMKQTAKRVAKAPTRNLYKVLPAGLLMTGMSRWTNYLRSGGESEKNKETSEIIYDSIARWGGNGIIVDSLNRAREASKYTDSSIPYLTMPFGPAGSDALSLVQQGLIPTIANKVPVYSGSYMGKEILGDRKVQHFKRSSRQLQEEVFGGLVPEFEKNVTPVGYAIGGIVKPATQALTKLATKVMSAPDEKLESTVSDALVQATDGIFDNKTMVKESNKVFNALEELDMEGRIDLGDFEQLDYIDALMVNEIQKVHRPLKELKKIPAWNKAMESNNPDSMRVNWDKAQDALKMSKVHKTAVKTISTLKNEVDPDGELEYLIPELVRDLKNKYQSNRLGITSVDRRKAKRSKFDEPTLNNTHDFLTFIVKENMDGSILSEKGAQSLASDIITKLASEGEIKFSKFKTPKLKANTTDLSTLSPVKRKKAQQKFVSKSSEKNPVYRGVTSLVDAEYNVAFAFPREIGTHVGTEGSATTILVRGLPNNLAKKDLKEAIDTGTLSRKEISDRFSDTRLVEKDLPEVNEFTPVMDDMPLDTGYFGKTVDEFDEVQIKPLTMQKGYIDVRNPLFIDTDLAGWEAERILTGGDWDEHFMKAIKVQGKELTDRQQKKVDDLTYRSMEFGKYFEGSYRAETILDAQRDSLKRTQINIEFRELLDNIGFDSIMYRNEVERGLADEAEYSYILFKPNQFKVTTSKGFDPKDMREGFKEGGSVSALTTQKTPKSLGKLAILIDLQ